MAQLSALENSALLSLGGHWHCPQREELAVILPLPERAPSNAIFHRCLGQKESAVPPKTGSHLVFPMMSIEGKDKGISVFFKKCDDKVYPPLLAEIEAAMSASYRIPLGKRAAYVRPVITDEGIVIGCVSYEIAGFKPMTSSQFTPEELLELDVAPNLVADFIRQDDDRHPGNCGCAPMVEKRSGDNLGQIDTSVYRIVDIDFDMSLYSYTYKIKGARLINGILTPLPAKAFPITDRDIENFPVLIDAQPCYFPSTIPINPLRQNNSLKSFQILSQNKEFHLKKNYAFLIELLIPPETHKKILKQSFSRTDESKACFKEVFQCISDIYVDLEQKLINNSMFRRFIVKNNNIKEKCIRHFKRYNQEIAKDDILFDLSTIERKYEKLVKKCILKDLTLSLFNMRISIHSHYNKSEAITKFFNRLVNICIEFEDSILEFNNSFTTFIKNLELVTIEPKMQAEWALHTKEFYTAVENYKGAFTNEHIWAELISVPSLRKVSSLSIDMPEVKPEITIAQALKNWLVNPDNKNRIVEIVGDVIDNYKPWEFLGMSPGSLLRTRVENLNKLLKSIKDIQNIVEIRKGVLGKYIIDFTKEGGWCEDGYVRYGSANVMLIERLSAAALVDFKNQLSLKQLKQHDLIHVFLIIEDNKTSLQSYTKMIAEQLNALL